MTPHSALRALLVGAALLTGAADAHPRPRPAPPEQVGFAQLQRVLDSARRVTLTLTVGAVQAAPGGQQTVTLTSGGHAVARVTLRTDGTLAPMPGGPPAPAARATVLTAAGHARLDALVAALTVSGAVQVTPGDYRVPLLSGGVVVAVLRLDRVTLQPRPDGPPRGPRARDGG